MTIRILKSCLQIKYPVAFPQNLQCVPFKFANSKIFIPATIDVFLPRFFLSLCNNSIVVNNMVQQQFIKSEPFTNRSILLEEIKWSLPIEGVWLTKSPLVRVFI